MMLRTKAPSDEGAVTEGDWGRENTGISMFFSPSGALRHLPHQREALGVRLLKQSDKPEFGDGAFLVAFGGLFAN